MNNFRSEAPEAQNRELNLFSEDGISESNDGAGSPEKISDESVALMAMEACLGTPGVAEMVGGANNISAFLGMEWPAKGVKISREREKEYSKEYYIVDVYLNVHFNSKIPEIAWNVQENVKNSLRRNMNIRIKKVNIHIQGVAVGGKEEKS